MWPSIKIFKKIWPVLLNRLPNPGFADGNDPLTHRILLYESITGGQESRRVTIRAHPRRGLGEIATAWTARAVGVETDQF